MQHRPTRRRLLRNAAGALGLSAARLAPARAQGIQPDSQDWLEFKSRFVLAEGRVVDTGNGGISHSEGQGWGLFAAVMFDDEATFDRLLSWTSRELRRPGDALHAWRYEPDPQNPVSDRNNATDGDIFIAAALARAADRWNRPPLRRQAEAIARDILRLLVRHVGDRVVLLPGASGFVTQGQVTLNPSYYVFPLFADLERLVPASAWGALQRDGLELLADGRFGRWMLPPDWLAVGGNGDVLAPAAAWPPRFSFDAIRVPLFLAWARLDLPPLADAFSSYWNSFTGSVPAWVDLATGQTAPYPASAGMHAVAAFAQEPLQPCRFRVETAADYYSAGLILLTRIAQRSGRLR